MTTTCFRLWLIILILFNVPVSAQQQDAMYQITDTTTIIEISNSNAFFVPKKFNPEKEFHQKLIPGTIFKTGLIQPENVSKKILLKFSLLNNQEDTGQFYFFPGFYFPKTTIYRIQNENIFPLPFVPVLTKDNASFCLLTVPPGDSISFLAEIYQIKTYNNVLRPRIIKASNIISYITELPLNRKSESLFTYFFCGLLMMMIIFSLANFYLGGNREFLYYAIYALLLGYMLFTKAFYYNRSYYKTFFNEEYFDFILQGIGICFYMAFMIRFLNTRKKHPFLHKVYVSGITGLSLLLILYTYIHYGTENYYFQNILENQIIKSLLLALVVIFLVYAIRNWQNKLLRLLFWGNLFFLLFSGLSLVIIFLQGTLTLPQFWRSALVWYQLGLLFELMFFLMALIYKNRLQIIEQVQERERLKLENERNKIEKQLAVFEAHQEERDRISADMHDELGSGMTTIRLMSEIAKNKMKQDAPIEIEKISASANDLLNKMNAIIWSMNSENDTVDNLVSYIRAYSIEYFEGTTIHCKITISNPISTNTLAGDKRRNIFLCLKETLNNVLKHSGATDLKINIQANNELNIWISDNGKGFNPKNIRQFGNGLKNIKRRMESIGGSFSIESENGTITTLKLPL